MRFRSGADPLLYLNNPAGISSENRKMALARWRELQEHAVAGSVDESVKTRLANYEMGFRMQTSVPEAVDLKDEPDHVLDMYGSNARDHGSFAANCVVARRLAERGVRFIQLFHQDWDHHSSLPGGLRAEAGETDQACGALLRDLKQRGMLDDTLVIWGGEFGRTNYCQGKFDPGNFGRDHHPRCFSIWMAGGGIKGGLTYGGTDEWGYNVEESTKVSVHDWHATLLHLLGIDHEAFTYLFQGRRYRLTDVFGKIVTPILA